MAKRKPASGGQSQGQPKQAGGASRSSNPQSANRSANTNHRDYSNSFIVFRYGYTDLLSAQKAGNAPAKHPTSSGKSSAQVTHSPE